jgi:hypothetical protein
MKVLMLLALAGRRFGVCMTKDNFRRALEDLDLTQAGARLLAAEDAGRSGMPLRLRSC